MTSWLGSLWGSSSASLPYELSPSPLSTSRSGWALFNASPKHKSSSCDDATAFRASKPELSKTPLKKAQHLNQLIPACHHFQRIKRLVHPRILRAHATLDTDYPNDSGVEGSSSSSSPGLDALDKVAATGTLIIITEKVDPLDLWLDDHLSPPSSSNTPCQNTDRVAWGIYNIIEALVFLHNQAKLAHGMLCPESVYVTPGGDFKLGGLELVTPLEGLITNHFTTYDAPTCPDEYRSPERLAQRYDLLSAAPVHSMDCYSLAVLIEYIYSHPNSGTNGLVPPPLQKALARMKNGSPKLRPRLQPLLKCPVFENPYVRTQLFLDEAMAKPAEERIAFLQNLPEMLNRHVLDERTAVFKLLPLLIMILKSVAGNETAMSQDVNRRQILAVVPLLFQIAESFLLPTHNGTTQQSQPSDTFQKHIVPLIPTLFGINDRGVRGAILQKISILSSQLDKPTINSQVFDPMCSGFTDTSGPLRELTLKSTMALVPKLHAASLEKLVRYLTRLQSDPEPSVRTNTIIFVGKVASSLSETSRQKLILPAFARAMKDEFTPCRSAALKSVTSCRGYFSQREVAERVLPCVVPHLLDGTGEVREEAFRVVEMFLGGLREESERMSSGPSEGKVEAPASGYLAGLSTWMSSGAESEKVVSGVEGPKFSSLSLTDAQIGGASRLNITRDRKDGWEEEEFDITDATKNTEEDDDFFAAFDSSRANPADVKMGSVSRPAPSLQSLKAKKASKPAVKKLPPSSSALDDGWDDF